MSEENPYMRSVEISFERVAPTVAGAAATVSAGLGAAPPFTSPITFYDPARPTLAGLHGQPLSPLQELEIEIGAERIASGRPAHEPADETNPKDRVGAKKVDLALVPAAALAHCAHAMMDGARKYGAYNFRDKAPRVRTYISAAQRHLAAFLDGEDIAADSGAHHLGHAMACCAILLDVLELDRAIDDRPTVGAASDVLARLNTAIAARASAQVA